MKAYKIELVNITLDAVIVKKDIEFYTFLEKNDIPYLILSNENNTYIAVPYTGNTLNGAFLLLEEGEWLVLHGKNARSNRTSEEFFRDYKIKEDYDAY